VRDRWFFLFPISLVMEGRYPWGRWPDFPLFVYLVSLANRARDGGRLRFSHKNLEGTCTVEPQRGPALVPSRDQLRRALERLAQHGLVELAPGERRRAQGRAQRFIDVTVLDAKAYGVEGGDSAQASAHGSAPQPHKNRATSGTPRSELHPYSRARSSSFQANEGRRGRPPRAPRCQCCERPSGGPRKSHEWEKTQRLFAEMKLDVRNRRKLQFCHLSDAELYALVRDARDGRKGMGWIWNSVKEMGRA